MLLMFASSKSAPDAPRPCPPSLQSPRTHPQRAMPAAPLPARVISLSGQLRARTLQSILRHKLEEGQPWARFTELNALLKGFRSHELTVLCGRTGTGKTTLLSEYSLDLCEQGVPTLWGSFEVPLFRLCSLMLHQFAGRQLHREPEDTVSAVMDAFATLPMHFLDYHGPQPTQTVLSDIQAAVTHLGVRHAVVDNLQFLLGAEADNSLSDRFLRQDRFVGQLRQVVNASGLHVSLVAHPKKEDPRRLLDIGSVYGGGKVTQEADNVLLLQDEAGMEERPHPQRYLQVAKNRYDGQLGRVPLAFDRPSKSYRRHCRTSEQQKPASAAAAAVV